MRATKQTKFVLDFSAQGSQPEYKMNFNTNVQLEGFNKS